MTAVRLACLTLSFLLYDHKKTSASLIDCVWWRKALVLVVSNQENSSLKNRHVVKFLPRSHFSCAVSKTQTLSIVRYFDTIDSQVFILRIDIFKRRSVDFSAFLLLFFFNGQVLKRILWMVEFRQKPHKFFSRKANCFWGK